MSLVAADLIAPSGHFKEMIRRISPKFKRPDIENIL
jgi:hypothetical protein